MEIRCERCGSALEAEGPGDAAATCPECGAAVGGRSASAGNERRATPTPRKGYDAYAVGSRVLRLAPGWLLLSMTAFVLLLVLFAWLSRPAGRGGHAGDDFINDMANRPPARNERRAARNARDEPAADARAEPGRAGEISTADREGASENGAGSDESEAFSVQVGAFADRSQANELVSRLRASGFDARVVEADGETRFRYQVRSGR